MTDDQLIAATAAAIAEDLFSGGRGEPGHKAKYIQQRDRYGIGIGNLMARGDVRRILAKHLAAMLAKREETGLPPECIYTAQQVRGLADGLRERGWEPEGDS